METRIKTFEELKSHPNFTKIAGPVGFVLRKTVSALNRPGITEPLLKRVGPGAVIGGALAGWGSGGDIKTTLEGAGAGGLLAAGTRDRIPVFPGKSIPTGWVKSPIPAGNWMRPTAVAGGLYAGNNALEGVNDHLVTNKLNRLNASLNSTNNADKAKPFLDRVGEGWSSMSPVARATIGIGGTSLAGLLLASVMMRNQNKKKQEEDSE